MINRLYLQQQSAALLAQEPKLRIKNVADRLGVCERDLVEAECCNIRSQYLGQDFKAIFKRLGELDEVMALTRNPWCVHERHGKYEDISISEAPVGLVLGPDIDLRLFFMHWGTVWYIQQGENQSLQFFDKAGVAIHKVYVTDKTNKDAWQTLIQDFISTDNIPDIEPISNHKVYAEQAPSDLRTDWLAMKDTHEFFPLLRKWNIPRVSALKAAGPDLAQQVPTNTVEAMLTKVVEHHIPIMCFVGNSSLIQIHSGPIKKLVRTGPWYNVLDPKFNLHLNTEAIDSVWIVNKPTEDGYITSIEIYEKEGELIAQFFGERKPGIPELKSWRDLLESFCETPLLG